jgi:uncharacterized protein (DUF2267 family)
MMEGAMTTTGLEVFDQTVQASNAWLHEIGARMGWDDRRTAYRLLRLSLHALRDRAPTSEAAQFAAQLPTLLRGVFYEGWRPDGQAAKAQTVEEFLAPLSAAFSEHADFNPKNAFRETLDVIRRHVSPGEIDDLRATMPRAIQTLWEG